MCVCVCARARMCVCVCVCASECVCVCAGKCASVPDLISLWACLCIQAFYNCIVVSSLGALVRTLILRLAIHVRARVMMAL